MTGPAHPTQGHIIRHQSQPSEKAMKNDHSRFISLLLACLAMAAGNAAADSTTLSEGWRFQSGATPGAAERLYILDPGGQAIWRYFPDGEGFTITESQQTLSFVDDVDLADVVDFAIYSEDGSVILLYRDGRLRRYVSGRALWTEADLVQGGLLAPLVGSRPRRS